MDKIVPKFPRRGEKVLFPKTSLINPWFWKKNDIIVIFSYLWKNSYIDDFTDLSEPMRYTQASKKEGKKCNSASFVQHSLDNHHNSKRTTTKNKNYLVWDQENSILCPSTEIYPKSPYTINWALQAPTSSPSHCLLSAPLFWGKQQRLTLHVCWSLWTKQQANQSIFNFSL